MAIDTARKRASVLSYALAPETIVMPQSGVPQADRQTINHLYGGILAAAPAVTKLIAGMFPLLGMGYG